MSNDFSYFTFTHLSGFGSRKFIVSHGLTCTVATWIRLRFVCAIKMGPPPTSHWDRCLLNDTPRCVADAGGARFIVEAFSMMLIMMETLTHFNLFLEGLDLSVSTAPGMDCIVPPHITIKRMNEYPTEDEPYKECFCCWWCCWIYERQTKANVSASDFIQLSM